MAKTTKKVAPIDRALARVAKARKRLVPDQGMVSRANARKEILASMRELRKALDRDFPNVPKKNKPRRKRARIKDGYVMLGAYAVGDDYNQWLTWMAESKTPIQVIRVSTKSIAQGTYVPEWAIAICERFGEKYYSGRAPSMLKKAKKDRSFREVELAAYKLKRDHQ